MSFLVVTMLTTDNIEYAQAMARDDQDGAYPSPPYVTPKINKTRLETHIAAYCGDEQSVASHVQGLPTKTGEDYYLWL
jgi:hypothetical protein